MTIEYHHNYNNLNYTSMSITYVLSLTNSKLSVMTMSNIKQYKI